MLTPQQIDSLINEPIYGWDSLTFLGDVEDFLDFSESNIKWQAERELRTVLAECEGLDFENPLDTHRYREHRAEGVRYRFDVSLTQRIRYSGLTAIITTVEWSLLFLKSRASFPIPEKPNRVNEAVHLLRVFAGQSSQELAGQIKEVELLAQVRNCVVHSAGRIESYEFGPDLRRALAGHSGLKLGNASLLGESIEVGEGYLQRFIEDAKRWLPDLEKAMHQRGLLK